MAEFTEALTPKHVDMIGKQPVFFVATACADGRITIMQGRTRSIDGLPTRATDRYFGPAE